MMESTNPSSFDVSSSSANEIKRHELLAEKVVIESAPDAQCYCGKPRDYSVPEFQCSYCYRWFHRPCISYDMDGAVPFMMAYHFMCKKCNNSTEEVFSRKQANFAMMCQTALANMMCLHGGRVYFSEEKELIPYLEENWELFTSQPRRTNNVWHANVHKSLVSNDQFKVVDLDNEHLVCLSCQDLNTIGPNYERFRALTSQLKTTVSKRGSSAAATHSGPPHPMDSAVAGADDFSTGPSSTGGASAGGDAAAAGVAPMADGVSHGGGGGGVAATMGKSLRKGGSGASLATSGGGVGSVRSTRRSAAAAMAANPSAHEDTKGKVSEFGMPLDHPLNVENFRYTLAEIDPHAKGWKNWEECDNTAGKPIPGYFYRVVQYPKVVLSMHDRGPLLKVNNSQTVVTGEKGYSLVRATHCVHEGTWYFEATVEEQPEGSAARIGWSQLMGNLQAPCGYDRFSYAWRSRLGTRFHDSRGKHYAEEGYGKGDVIGCLIHLPKAASADLIPSVAHYLPAGALSGGGGGGGGAAKSSRAGGKSGAANGGGGGGEGNSAKLKAAEEKLENYLPETYKDRPLIRFRNNLFFEEKFDLQAMEKQLKPLPKSKIVFYRNGECQGVAYEDIYAGAYFPALSLYKSITISANFGPDFKYPPPASENWLPMSSRVESAEIEQCVADVVYLQANDKFVERIIKECSSQQD